MFVMFIIKNFKELYWVLAPKPQLSTYNNFLVYTVVLKPIWTYGLSIWGSVSRTNINILQRSQNKILKKILGGTLVRFYLVDPSRLQNIQ